MTGAARRAAAASRRDAARHERVRFLTNRVPPPARMERPRAMLVSRLALALLVSLRATLIYGEAPSASSVQVGWRELLPERWRVARPQIAAGAALMRRAAS
jgi:hypothetical protein